MDNGTLIEIFTYHRPTVGSSVKFESLREKAKELAVLINKLCPESREKSLAITDLQRAVMMANAAIAIHEKEGQ